MKRLHEDHNSKQCILDTVRRAIAIEGEGPASLAAHLGVTPSYVHAVLNDKSPMGVRFIMGLPTPVLRRLFQFAVEYYGGVVVWPATDKETALKQKVASLEFELKMAKMELPERQLEKVG
jgi:hypothetical protein